MSDPLVPKTVIDEIARKACLRYKRYKQMGKTEKEKPMLEMIGDRVAIELEDATKVTPGGIHLPDNAKDKPTRGTVVGVGIGVLNSKGGREPLQVAKGDVVLIGVYDGVDVEVNERTIRIVREDQILARVG